MTSNPLGDVTPLDAAHYVVETLLEVVVGALLVTAVSAVVVWLVRDEAPVTLVVLTLLLAVTTGLLWNRTTNLGARIEVARSRALRAQDD